MIKNPILTIIMPCYNSWPYIRQSVTSILEQTYKDFSLIIVNDGSKDQTVEYLKSIKDKRVVVIHKKHSGIIESVNSVIPLINSKYVARVDSDDIYLPNKFELQIDFLEKNHEVSLVGSDAFYLAENGKTSKIKISVPSDHDKIVDNLFLKKRSIIQSTMVLRTAIFKELKGYRLNKMPEDFDLFFRIGLVAKVANISIPLSMIRIHNSFSNNNLINLLEEYDKLILEFHSFYDINLSKSPKNKNYKQNLIIVRNRNAINVFLNKNRFLGVLLFIINFLKTPSEFFKHFRKFLF